MSVNSISNAPLFIVKLWKMVNKPELDDKVCWNEPGTAIIITNQVDFCNEILPQFYKHNNMSSFVRQLNIYGFHKIATTENGTMNTCKGNIVFYHPDFQKDRPNLLQKIKRKPLQKLNSKHINFDNNINLSNILDEIHQITNNSNSQDKQLVALKRENVVLWKELGTLKTKYSKQSSVLNNLVHFIMTFVQKHVNEAKIRYQLEPNDLLASSSVNTNSNSDSDSEMVIQKFKSVLPQLYGSAGGGGGSCSSELSDDETLALQKLKAIKSILPQIYGSSSASGGGGSSSELSDEETDHKALNTLVSWQKKTSSISDDDEELMNADEDDQLVCSVSPINITDVQPIIVEEDSNLIENDNDNVVIEDMNVEANNLDTNNGIPDLNFLTNSPYTTFSIDEAMNAPIVEDPMISGYKINSEGLEEFLNDQNEDRKDVQMFEFNSK